MKKLLIVAFMGLVCFMIWYCLTGSKQAAGFWVLLYLWGMSSDE